MARRPSSIADDHRPAVAIFRSPLFNASESFVQAHAAGLVRYRSLPVGLEDKGHAWPELSDRLVLPRSTWEALRFKLLGDVGAMAGRLRRESPRLVHAHFATDGLLALPLADALGVPLVTTLHGYDVSRSRGRMLSSGRLSWINYALRRRRLMEEGRLFLAVSDAIRTRALAQGYPAERTLTHNLGVDLGRFGADPGAAEAGLVLHVGRLVEKKGTALLLDAFARLPSQAGAELVIIGDGPERSRLERRCSELGIGSSVRFLGELPRDEVAAWMRLAWLFVAPSVTARDGDSEGLPTVVIEAAASGVPAVGTHHAGIPEAIRDGQTGLIVPERDTEALARSMARLLDSAELRHRMGAAARALAEDRFDSARQNAVLEEHYDALLRQTRP